MNRAQAATIDRAGQLLQDCIIQPHRDFTTMMQALLDAQATGALPDNLAADVARFLTRDAPGIGASLERAASQVGDLSLRLMHEASDYLI